MTPIDLSERKILIVEDEPDLIELLKEELELLGAEVKTASCGNDALEILKSETFDALITDSQMPNGTGTELLEGISKNKITVPVKILLTGFTKDDAQDVYNLGANAIFSKPCDYEKLSEVLDTAIRHTSPGQQYRRKHARVYVNATAQFSLPNSTPKTEVKGEVFNLSLDGAFFHFEGELPSIDSEIDFSILYKTRQKETIELSGKGQVKWIRNAEDEALKRGIGTEFSEISHESRDKIDLIIKDTLAEVYSAE